MFNGTVKVNFSPEQVDKKHRQRFLGASGVQARFTSRIIRDTNPYTPMDTGMLASSPSRASDYESGNILYNVPYAKALYDGTSFNFSRDKHPQATHHWFEKPKAVLLDAWGVFAARLVGGIWRKKG